MVIQSPNNASSNNSIHISVPDLLHSFKHGAGNSFHDYNSDSNCSTPYVSAPSSPGRIGVYSRSGDGYIGGGGGFNGPSGYFFSAPTSPMRSMFSSCSTPVSSSSSSSYSQAKCSSSEFEFSSRFSSEAAVGSGSMISADELFFNGQIRPTKLSSHLQRPQTLGPLLDLEEAEEDEVECRNDGKQCEESFTRGRDLKLRNRSVHRKTRSMSPLRNSQLRWPDDDDDAFDDSDLATDRVVETNRCDESEKQIDARSTVTTPSVSTSSSRSSSSGSRNSKKWIFLKEFLYKSKSEGSGTKEKDKFWSSISFTPAKASATTTKQRRNSTQSSSPSPSTFGKPLNGVAKRRTAVPPPSAHELHYTANRAQAEELKKKTYLPYRQGLFGCLGFSSKGYGALNGFARTLNPVSSR